MNSKLFFVIILGCALQVAHNLIPYSSTEFSLFFFSAQKLTYSTYLYFLFNEIIKVLLLYAIYIASEKKVILYICMAQILVLIDYFLRYNEPLVFGANIVHVILIFQGILLIFEAWKYKNC